MGIAIVSEPRTIPNTSSWLGSEDELAAVCWVHTKISNCKLVKRRERYVIVQVNGWGQVNVISCYLAPSMTWEDVNDCLDLMREDIRELGGDTIVGGDFNAKSPMWGSPSYSSSGRIVEDWAAELELCLLNEGNAPTCIRPQGVLIIDISWCTKDMRTRVSEWGIRMGVETLSDHVWIEMTLGGTGGNGSPRGSNSRDTPRWKRNKWNFYLFRSVMEWELTNIVTDGGTSVEKLTGELEDVL